MHNGAFVGRAWWCGVVLMVAAGCSDKKVLGDECLFNDDCVSPLVCSARRCRVQCRSDRDCAMGTVCAPADDPRKRVCLPLSGPSECASDVSCPRGSVCAASACWWRCADDNACATLGAGTCQTPELLCATPISVEQQRALGGQAPEDGGVATDAGQGAPDGGASTDVQAMPDVPVATDVQAMPDVPVAMDVPAMPDVPTTPDVAADQVSPDVAVSLACRSDGDCAFRHASGRCMAGACAFGACDTGYGDCNGSAADGCETDTFATAAHCGSCGFACPVREGVGATQCAGGVCAVTACAAGRADCNNNPGDGCEVALTTVNHCGACGNACSADTALHIVAAACVSNRCGYSMCLPGYADCDGLASNGCEVDVLTSTNHCGACATACPSGANATTSCARGACVQTCAAGYGDCDAMPANGCEQDLRTSPDHCGSCGNRLGATQVCLNGVARDFPYGNMDSTEALVVTTDTTVSSGTYRYASVRIAAGATLRVRAPGVLDLRARGPIEVLGTIDLSGGRGGDNARTDLRCEGGNGGGGDTGVAVAAPNGLAGTCRAPGASGQGTAGSDARHVWGACGTGSSFGGGAGGGAVGPTIIEAGGGGGGGGGFGGGAGGGGFGNAADSGAGGGDGSGTTSSGGASTPVQGGGNPGNVRVAAGATFYNGQAGLTAAPNRGGGGGGGGSIGYFAAVDPFMITTFRVGSGGGGGGGYGASVFDGATEVRCAQAGVSGGAGGGGGGGALRLASATAIRVAASGALLVRGGAGGNAVVFHTVGGQQGGGGAGGGGSGGAIAIVSPVVVIDGVVDTVGGVGGRPVGPSSGFSGGAGGMGRVRVSVLPTRCSLAGTWVPQLEGSNCPLSSTTSPDPGRTVITDFGADLVANRLR